MKFLYSLLLFFCFFQITAFDSVCTPSRPALEVARQIEKNRRGELYSWLRKVRDPKSETNSSFEEETPFNATEEPTPNYSVSRMELARLEKKFGTPESVAPKKLNDVVGKIKQNKVIRFNFEIMFGRTAGTYFKDTLREGKRSFEVVVKDTIKEYTKKDELEDFQIKELFLMATTRNLKKENFWNDSFEKYYAQLTQR